MRKYNYIFFDLDHTLWDFERNSQETLHELYHLFELINHGVHDPHEFISTYKKINYAMWEEYRNNRIDRETLRNTRFQNALKQYKVVNENLAAGMSHEYLQRSPFKKNLFDGAKEVLQYLKGKGYGMSIITNGFEDVQTTKIRESGIENYFDKIIISEVIGYKKPEKEYFEYTMEQHFCDPHECIVIGDNIQSDIIGAVESGIDQVWFNPLNEKSEVDPTFEIAELSELKSIL